MKKILSLLITMTILMTSLTAAHCEDDIRVTLDGNEIAFDVPPQIIDDRTLVPMRAIFEALGAEVTWNGETRTITAINGEKTITMAIGSHDMYVNSNTVTLDVPPMIIDDRTLVPVRAVSESLDCGVLWDGENRVVVIASAKTEVVPTNPPSAIPIEYDDTTERKAHYARNFHITAAEKNSDGNYVINYTLQTFLEGRGAVSVNFRCLDANGNIVDTFGGVFVGTDYTWSDHTSSAVISNKTVKIELDF